jgi:hypothetical protein
VVLASVLHCLTANQAEVAAVAFKKAITPGSYLIVWTGTCTGTSPVLIERLAAAYAGTTVVTARLASRVTITPPQGRRNRRAVGCV